MLTILLVDDDSEIRTSLCAVLNAHGYGVAEAADGAEALSIALAHKPSIVVSDWVMPVLDGPGLYQKFHAHPSLCSVPFIFMSGTAFVDELQGVPTLPFFRKPFDPASLIETIRGISAGLSRFNP